MLCEIKKKFPSIFDEQVYVLQLNVVVIEPPIQSDSSFRNLILNINDINLCIAFSILIFFILTGFYLILYSFVKNVDQESLTFRIFQRKEGIADAYRVDEIDVDSYFFYNFLDVFTQNNRIIRFSKGFEYATFSIKKFENDDYITKQSFDLSSELHINKYEMLFILSSVPEIIEQYRNLSQSNYIPIPEPVTFSSSLQSSLFFHYYKDYNAEGVRVRFEIRLLNTYIQKFSSKFGKFSEMERNYQSLTFLANYVNSFPLTYPSLAAN